MVPSISTLSLVTLASVVAFLAQVDARLISVSPRLHRRFTFVAQPAPDGWATEQLESYGTYHFRYLATGCHKNHDSEFFEQCCHPRKKYETDADFPAQCTLSPDSIAAADKILAASAGTDGLVEEGKTGKGIYVPKGQVEALKPKTNKDGTVAFLPPSEKQLAAIAKAKAALEASAKSDSTGSKTSDSPANTTDNDATASAEAEAAAKAAAEKAAADKAAAEKAAAQEAASKAADEKAAAQKAADEKAAQDKADAEKAAQEQAAAQKAADQAAADKAAAEKAASDKAAAEKAAADKAAADKAAEAESNNNNNNDNDNDNNSGGGSGGVVSSVLSGVKQVFGENDEAHGTFFFQNNNPGNCGDYNTDDRPIIALQTSMYGDGSNCGRTVLIKNLANGKEVKATVADSCPTCVTPTSIDLSTGAYDQIADRDTGIIKVVWGFTS